MSSGIEIKGLAELIANIQKLPVSMRRQDSVLNGVTLAAARKLRDIARQKAPVKTGKLRKSISARKSRPKNSNQLAAKVIASDPTAHLVEYGHRLLSHKPSLKEIGEVEPHPFMRPALDEGADEALAFAEEYARDRLEKEIAGILGGSK